MTLNQLNYFIEVCQQQNITKAADLLHISQPSLTVAIKNLEKELGISLFHRVKKRIELTEAGELFRKRLTPILAHLEQLETEMISLGANSNVLKIGIPPMIGSILFPDIFAQFKALYPEIQLETTEAGAYKIIEYLLDDTLDLSLLHKQFINNQKLHFTPIAKLGFSLYMKSDHPLAHKESITATDLEGEPLILFNKEFMVNATLKEWFDSHNLKPNTILETTQINTIKRFVNEGLALSILMDGTFKKGDGISIVPITSINPISVGLVRKTDHFVTDSAAKMIHFIQKKYSHICD